MQQRKIQPDRLFDGHKIVTGHVLITSEEGTVEAVVPTAEAGEGVERVAGLLTPGFINCHCHLELSHMKGLIPERTGLVDFVFKIVTQRSAPDEEILGAVTDAEAAMKAAGIVAVGDICNTTLTLPQKEEGNLRYYNFIEASGWVPSVSEARFERAKWIYDAYSRELSTANHESKPAPFLSPAAIVPHAPYSVSDDLWRRIQPSFKNKVVCIHNQETAFEDEFFMHGTGNFTRMYELMNIDNSHHLPTKRSSLQSYFTKLSGAANILLVHNTFTRQEDVNYVKKLSDERAVESGENSAADNQRQRPNRIPQTFFCLCVNANQYIECALPPVEMLQKNDCNIVLGTDSLASNWSLSILDEMKTIRTHFPHIALDEVLRWATINGAKALGMENEVGSFEKGKMPGAVLIDEGSLNVKNIFF